MPGLFVRFTFTKILKNMDNNLLLKGKVAIVTGASKGIGSGIALELAKAGASVVINYFSNREDAEKLPLK